MIYEIKKKESTYKVDDLVFLADQPKAVQAAISELQQGNIAYFDNAMLLLLETGRILVTLKQDENV